MRRFATIAVAVAALSLPALAQGHVQAGGFLNLLIGQSRDSRRELTCEPSRPSFFGHGHYETRQIQVWVPATTRQVWVEPEYCWNVDPCGNSYRVMVRAGYFRSVCEPAHYEMRDYQVWVDGRFGGRREGFRDDHRDRPRYQR